MRMTISAFVATIFLLLAGCGQPTKSTATSAQPAKPRIALVMKSLANEFFLTMENGAREHQKKHAAEYEILANGIKDEIDVSKQIDLVQQMIAQRVDAIVIAPADSKALINVCKQAMDAGIVVVNIDNKLDSGVLSEKKLQIPFVGPDNRKGAKLAGDYLAKQLKANDKVAVIEGVPTAFNAIQRRTGFEDAMKAAQVSIVSSQVANWEMDKASQIAAAILTEHPDIKAILCANDSMALGAVAAVKAASVADRVAVVGFDNISSVQQLIKEKKVLATVDQHADQLAAFGIEYALDIIRKKQTPVDRETKVDLITADNLK